MYLFYFFLHMTSLFHETLVQSYTLVRLRYFLYGSLILNSLEILLPDCIMSISQWYEHNATSCQTDYTYFWTLTFRHPVCEKKMRGSRREGQKWNYHGHDTFNFYWQEDKKSWEIAECTLGIGTENNESWDLAHKTVAVISAIKTIQTYIHTIACFT